MRKLGLQIQDWFLGEQDLSCFVFCRVLFGGLLFFYYLNRITEVETLYGPSGVAPYGDGPTSLDHLLFFPMDLLKAHSSQFTVWAIYFGLLACAILFVFGFKTRWTGLILLVLHSFLLSRSPGSYWGWASMTKPFLFYTIMAPCGRGQNHRGSAWPLRLMQMHVCTMYMVAGWVRLGSYSWQHGEMLYTMLSNHYFSRFAVDWRPYKSILTAICYGPFILEPLAPFFLWVKGVGKYFALALVGLHVGIEITATVGPWNYLMIGALTSFIPIRWLPVKKFSALF